ncbi:MAG: fatty acyl-AMP ligase [Cyanobacteria bacterium J06627_28]
MTAVLSPSPGTIPEGLSLCELLDYRAWHQPEQLAYQYLSRGETVEAQLTYLELQNWVAAIASQLRVRDATGGRALLLFSPGVEFVAAFLGCLAAGVTAVPAYPPRKNQKMLRLQAIVQDADATIALTTAPLESKISQWFSAESPLGNLDWLKVDSLPEVEGYNSNPANPLAFLQYTSGSTGTPKGVMVSHSNLMNNLAAIYRCFGHSAQSRGVIWLPPYHDMGLIGGVLQPLYSGFPVTLMSPVDFLQKPLRWIQAISNHQATTSGGPDFAYDLCVRRLESLRQRGAESKQALEAQLNCLDLSCWQVAFTGAEPVRADTLTRFADAFSPYGFRQEAFYPCYGMAETTLIVSGGAVSASPVVKAVSAKALGQHRIEQLSTAAERDVEESHSEESCKVVGCGQVVKGHQVEIVHPELKTRCQHLEVGEIWVAGKSVARGYWQDPERTVQSFQAYLADTGEGPFLRTGDLGFVMEGELFITGRIKDVMIIRGQNFYPQDVERTLEVCHPALRMGASAAFSVEHQGSERLVVMCEVERSHLRQLDVHVVSSAIRQAITAAHGLQVYATLLVKPGSIPKTSSGKIQRYRCRKQFLSGELKVVEEWNENPRHQREFVKIQSEVDAILQSMGARK